MRLRLLYEAARVSMRVRGLVTHEVHLPAGAPAQRISYLDGRGLCEGGGNEGLVVMVHGLGSSIATWSSVLPEVSRAAPCVAPDLPGYGRTPLPAGVATLSLQEQVDTILAFVDAVSPEHPVQLVGQSMGGWIAARVAVERPKRVSRLTLVNSAGVFTPQVFQQRQLFSPANRSELRRLWRRMWHRMPISYYLFEGEYLKVTRDPHIRGFLDSVQEEDFLNDDLARIRAPTLLVWGLSDGFIDYGAVRVFRHGIRDLRVRRIPDCGHVVQRERPREFLHYLLPWLRGDEPPHAPPAPPGRVVEV